MPHTHVEVSQTGFQGSPHADHEHLKIHRLNENQPADNSHYLIAGLVELTAGVPIPAHYHGPAVLYIIEGEVHFQDNSNPDEITKLAAGDVLHVDQGSHNTFTTPDKAKMFGVTYAPSDPDWQSKWLPS